MSRRWLKLLLLCVLAGALLLPPAAASAGAPAAHWAAQDADNLAAKLGWSTPLHLDAPIPVLEWNRVIAMLAGVQPGDADPAANPKQNGVWMYTGGISPGSMVLRREDAIGGLMKLASLLYKEQANSGDPKLLDAYADGTQVSDRQRPLVAGAIKFGLVKGYPGGMLYPQRPVTYAEAAALLSRVIDRYEPAWPLPAKRAVQEQAWPRPNGFGLYVPAEQVINSGWPVGTVGPAWWVVHGAAYITELPGSGVRPPEGHVWLVVDTELINWDRPEFTYTPESTRFVLNDAQLTQFEYPVDTFASRNLGSPFHRETRTLKQGDSMRGFLVFAVPAGTRGIWIECDTTLGHAPGKTGWNGSSRTPLGDLPGQ